MIKIIKKFNSPYHFGREEKVEFMYEFQAWFILLESTYNVVNVHIYDTTKYTTNSKSSLHTKIQAKLVQQCSKSLDENNFDSTLKSIKNTFNFENNKERYAM